MRVLCRDAEWLVTRVDPSDNAGKHFAVHCVGADDLVRGHEAIFLTQLDELEPVDPRNTQLVEDTSPGYRMAKLFLEAQLRQMPTTGLEPNLDGLGVFRPMDFQLKAAQLALSLLRPRLLLADAVGLGKTIEVGMILTELIRRGRGDRILVLARKSMLTQFQSELWNRFTIPLVRLDSQGISRLRLRIPANKNPFEVYHRIIISIDTLKNVGRYRHFLESTRWDVVVIDEAHNVAGASVPERHLAHRLARLLSTRTNAMLLTTATPHNGKRETFGRLISLLDPSAIPDPQMREYSAEDIRGFFLMRFKEDVRDQAGENFTERQVVPLAQTSCDASEAEEKVYDLLGELRDAAKRGRERGETWASHGLVLYGLYKLFLSSPEACRSTVGKRLERLRTEDPECPEIPFLARLLPTLRALDLRGSSRYALLKEQLATIQWDGTSASPRVLVFTESRRTQDALAESLAKDYKVAYSSKFEAQPTQPIAVIHGGTPDIHLMKTVEAFSTGGAAVRLLLATDVASEGINLHHQCHHVVHYDLPWSIITLIQRNGRIDRFGQKHPPILRYLTVNTDNEVLAGDRAIFDRLVSKVEEINSSTRQGETVLKLYDPEAEERYVAEHGVLAGDSEILDKSVDASIGEASDLEQLLDDGNLRGNEDFLQFLLGEDAGESGDPDLPPTSPQGVTVSARPRLYTDLDFLVSGYEHLRSTTNDYHPIERHGALITVTAPPDLRRRLGAPDERGDVIFGATAIPSEAWPEHGQFKLTDEPARVERAIEAARNTEGYWASELLCTEQHPILRWIGERLLLQLRRGEAPIVASRHLERGELCFVFIGQLSSKAGTPLIVDAHAASFYPGGRDPGRIQPIHEAMERIGFEHLVNTGTPPNAEAARLLLSSAIDASLAHMGRLEEQRVHSIRGPLRREERRLRAWADKRRWLLGEKIQQLGPSHPTARRWKSMIEDMDGYIRDRQQNWRDTHVVPASSPTTRLVMVAEGVER